MNIITIGKNIDFDFKGKINYYYYYYYYYLLMSDIPFQNQETWGWKNVPDPSCLRVAAAQIQVP